MPSLRQHAAQAVCVAGLAVSTLTVPTFVQAAPVISRLTPPSALFTFNDPNGPYTARFLPDQRFDLQITVKPDADQTITSAEFFVNGRKVNKPVALAPATASGLPSNTVVMTIRAYANDNPGVHTVFVRAKQSDGQHATARGNFEIVKMHNADLGKDDYDKGGNGGRRRAKNIIYLIGDGMGIAHRTAARLMLHGAAQGKANAPLAMDTFPFTGLVATHSLNSIVTDSSPGAACYANGNKSNNNQQGVFPDDTTDNFDNPRVELIGEYLWRKQGRTLGIVTTSDVFDATPGAFGTHTANRGAGTGIVDQYLDEAVAKGGLRVLMGGGRKWFLPQGTPGSARALNSDYVLPADLSSGWNVPAGEIDPQRDVIADFENSGFEYVYDTASLGEVGKKTDRLLGLFSFSNMNVAKDKIDKRRNPAAAGVVDDFGFPDQPMLDEMTAKALDVLSRNKRGFTLMVEAASIDKQAHNMDTERWILDTIEFDRAIAVCKKFAEKNGDTLVIVTADHECAGINIIGGSRVTNADLQTRAAGNTNGPLALRDQVVGIYEGAGFPFYPTANDGYPTTTDVDFKMLIGYAGNSDRYEDWLTNPLPLRDSQQPFNNVAPLSTYPTGPLNRDVAGGFGITGQVPGGSAVHTGSDIPVSAYGIGSSMFSGVMDNTDVFFKAMQAALGGTRIRPEALW
ncbi:MAG: alkaline phosphatase [Verrucomicrobia bacterium]|nr:alkaline phosphatase [Verrucomicrobiota bacterium]